MFEENTPDVHSLETINPSQLLEPLTMTNILFPIPEHKPEILASEAGSCGAVADGVAADVAPNSASKWLNCDDVADVSGEPGEEHPIEDGAALLDEITSELLRHVVMATMYAQAVALWIMHAHTIDAHRHTPRLAITSPIPNCGKTTLCSAIALLTGSLVVSNTTTAAFFRRVDKEGPRAVILDEVDTFLSADNQRGIGILNAGHAKAGAYVEVAEATGEGFEPRRFCVWAPVVFGLIGKLPAPSLDSRSINILLKRKRPDEHAEPIFSVDEELFRAVKVRAVLWGGRMTMALRGADPALPACLYNRDRDNWRPLVAVADVAGGHWPATAREIAAEFNGQAEDPSEGVMLLADIRRVFDDDGTGRLSTEALIAALAEMEERPWNDFHDRGCRIGGKQLARLLRVFGIHSNSIRIGDRTPKGYMRAWFEDAFDRYLPGGAPDPTPSATSATVTKINGLPTVSAAMAGATPRATEVQQG
jgi:hypothetical protein